MFYKLLITYIEKDLFSRILKSKEDLQKRKDKTRECKKNSLKNYLKFVSFEREKRLYYDRENKNSKKE